MSPGDTVVLYSDGVSEASNPDGEEYGIEALRKLIAEQHPTCCPSKLVQACKQRLTAFRGPWSAPTTKRCWRFSTRRRCSCDARSRRHPAALQALATPDEHECTARWFFTPGLVTAGKFQGNDAGPPILRARLQVFRRVPQQAIVRRIGDHAAVIAPPVTIRLVRRCPP